MDRTNTSLENPMTKKQAIDYLTANVAAWANSQAVLEELEDEMVVNLATEAVLSQRNAVVANCVRDELDMEDEEVDDAVVGNAFPDFLKKKMGEKSPMKKKLPPVEEMTEEEDDMEDEEEVENKKTKNGTYKKTKNGMTKKYANNAQTWLTEAPREVQEVFRVASELVENEKAKLVKELVSNASAERRKELAATLMRKSVDELRTIHELARPEGIDRQVTQNRFMRDVESLVGSGSRNRVANFFGAGVTVPTTNESSGGEKKFEPLPPAPKIDWAELSRTNAK